MKAKRPERYETLGRVRKHQETQRAQALAQVRRTVRELEEQRHELESYQKRILVEAGRQSTEPKARRMQALYQFQRHLGLLTDKKEVEIDGLTQEVETRRLAFEESVKNRRIVERLVERAEEDARKHFARRTQRLQDEFASVHFARESLSQRRESEAEHDDKVSGNNFSVRRLLPSGLNRAGGGHGEA